MYDRQVIFNPSVTLKNLLDTLFGEVVKIMPIRGCIIPAKCGYFLYVFPVIFIFFYNFHVLGTMTGSINSWMHLMFSQFLVKVA